MAIKDLIGPSFVGATTIKWIVTRGLTAAAVVVAEADQFYAVKGITNFSGAARGITNFSAPVKGITNFSAPVKGDQ